MVMNNLINICVTREVIPSCTALTLFHFTLQYNALSTVFGMLAIFNHIIIIYNQGGAVLITTF